MLILFPTFPSITAKHALTKIAKNIVKVCKEDVSSWFTLNPSCCELDCGVMITDEGDRALPRLLHAHRQTAKGLVLHSLCKLQFWH